MSVSLKRALLVTITGVALAVSASDTIHGFALFGTRWRDSTVTLHLRLIGGSGLSDGSSSFNAAFAAAMSTWNESLSRIQFVPVIGSPGRGVDNDSVNQVFFDSTIYGDRFGPEEVAVTTRWYLNDYPSQHVETDVVFNSAFNFDSYRGALRANGVPDFRRIALHELGHALGLAHPDAVGQSVVAIMNTRPGDVEALTADDIAGAQALYGAGAAGTIMFPPRNEPNDFFNQLQAVYQNELRLPPSPTYVDSEGAVIWLTEYARQRAGQCEHATATANTLAQIAGGAGTLVCAATPAGAIPFPPRDQGLLFMNELDATYRDTLGRSLSSSAIDNEGAVVWVLEYLRYRLNGCNHGDATVKVLQQIRGQGIQPTCSA